MTVFSDFDYKSYKKMYIQRHSTHYFKIHRISNSMSLKLSAQNKVKMNEVELKFDLKNWVFGGLLTNYLSRQKSD